MSDKTAAAGVDSRREPRVHLAEQVTIRFDSGSIVGPGQNVSSQGVFFTAAASIPVTVRIDGKELELPGELVRVETMGDGRVGIAVRFLAPVPELSA
jgi:hypothetical protein